MGKSKTVTMSNNTAAASNRPIRKVEDIECWGHRGASAHLPENTLASFRAAILEGAKGIESGAFASGPPSGRC